MRRLGICLLCPLGLTAVLFAQAAKQRSWAEVEVKGKAPHKRHEHAFVKVGDAFYALGGRRVQSVDRFDPKTATWSTGSKPPIELHHFQALAHEGKVLVAGAFTGRFPAETPVATLYAYDPKTDAWSEGAEIPEERRRGSAGAFLKNGKLYLICGLTDGHRSGWVTWFDEYDFATEEWRQLPDAPRARDHFQAVLVGNQLVLAGGRRSGEGGEVFTSVIKEVDVYDFETGQWRTLPSPIGDLPTPRAGTMSLAIDDKVWVIGGESAREEAHVEVDALNLKAGTWKTMPALPLGRHATQPILHDRAIYLQAGSVTRGGTETDTMLRLPLGRPPAGELVTSALRDFETLEAPRQKLLELALATGREFTLNDYHFGSADPGRGGFDCSGAIYYLLQEMGLEPARSSAAQYDWLQRNGALNVVPPDVGSLDDKAFADLQPGDLLFWAGTYQPKDGRENKITHVQMYLGREKADGRRVMIGSTDGRSYRGTRRCGYGVYDLRLPRPTSKARLVGYGTPPGLLPKRPSGGSPTP